MKENEYFEIFVQTTDLATVEIPTESLPGEEPGDAIARWLEESGILTEASNGTLLIDFEKAKAFDPNLVPMLKAMQDAQLYATLDDLESKGLIYTSVDEDGQMVFGLTEAGHEIADDLFGMLDFE